MARNHAQGVQNAFLVRFGAVAVLLQGCEGWVGQAKRVVEGAGLPGAEGAEGGMGFGMQKIEILDFCKID